jgi:DNA-binding transcriptional regulator YiaG
LSLSTIFRLKPAESRIIMRRRLKLKQEELAKILGYNVRWVKFLESGQRDSHIYDTKLQNLYNQRISRPTQLKKETQHA